LTFKITIIYLQAYVFAVQERLTGIKYSDTSDDVKLTKPGVIKGIFSSACLWR